MSYPRIDRAYEVTAGFRTQCGHCNCLEKQVVALNRQVAELNKNYIARSQTWQTEKHFLVKKLAQKEWDESVS